MNEVVEEVACKRVCNNGLVGLDFSVDGGAAFQGPAAMTRYVTLYILLTRCCSHGCWALWFGRPVTFFRKACSGLAFIREPAVPLGFCALEDARACSRTQ